MENQGLKVLVWTKFSFRIAKLLFATTTQDRAETSSVLMTQWQNCGGTALTIRSNLAVLMGSGSSMAKIVSTMLPQCRYCGLKRNSGTCMYRDAHLFLWIFRRVGGVLVQAIAQMCQLRSETRPQVSGWEFENMNNQISRYEWMTHKKYLSTWIPDMLDYHKNGLEIVSIFTPEKTMEEKQGYGFISYFQVICF